jgi:hypothetical protein
MKYICNNINIIKYHLNLPQNLQCLEGNDVKIFKNRENIAYNDFLNFGNNKYPI